MKKTKNSIDITSFASILYKYPLRSLKNLLVMPSFKNKKIIKNYMDIIFNTNLAKS